MFGKQVPKSFDSECDPSPFSVTPGYDEEYTQSNEYPR